MKTYRGFFDTHQMNRYLRHCIIRVSNEPVYVYECFEGRQGDYIKYDTIKDLAGNVQDHAKEVGIYSNRVNLAPVPLGLFNFVTKNGKSVFNLSRLPIRTWKIGLHENNLKVLAVLGGKIRLNYENVIYSKEFRNTVLGIYPSYPKVLKTLTGAAKSQSIAFNRHFGLRKTRREFELFYYRFSEPVGMITKEKLVLWPAYTFLKEHLEEDPNVPKT